MNSNEGTGDSIHVNIQGPVSGQVAAGRGISQTRMTSASRGAVTEADLDELRHVLLDLQAQVNAHSPPDQKTAAIERVRELQTAIISEKPDLTTMEYVRNWFVKHLPALAQSVGSIVVHPIVGRLVEAGGETLVAEFRRRFGGHSPGS
jgi:hypothetical protein